MIEAMQKTRRLVGPITSLDDAMRIADSCTYSLTDMDSHVSQIARTAYEVGDMTITIQDVIDTTEFDSLHDEWCKEADHNRRSALVAYPYPPADKIGNDSTLLPRLTIDELDAAPVPPLPSNGGVHTAIDIARRMEFARLESDARKRRVLAFAALILQGGCTKRKGDRHAS